MLTDKRCPKCGGNTYTMEDHHGKWEECLQCGHTSDPDNVNLKESDLPKARRWQEIKRQK